MATGDHDWTAGEQVTAANMDDYLQLQVVQQFATSAARDTALSARKREGMVAYSIDEDRYYAYTGAAWVRVAYLSTAGRTGGTWTRSAVQSISNNTLSNISWDAETSDSDGFLTPTSITLTVPTGFGGLYLVTATITYATATLNTNYIVINNGGGTRTLPANGNATNVQHVTALMPLAATDTIVIQTLHNNGGAQNANARLDVYRIGL